MTRIRVTHTVEIPDPIRISRYQKIPELGPKVLFFSGGTALKGISKVLKNYTHNSIHLVTPFDSGGSSAELRKAFDMPSIGDLRARLMALADESVLGHPEIYELFNHRFPRDRDQKALHAELKSLVSGDSALIAGISNSMRQLICNQLGYFTSAMPDDFDLRGASVGNLILAGGYLNNHQELDPIIFLFSKLVNVQGTVRAVVDDDLHLAVELEDGNRVVGQHRITGKEVAPLTSPITSLSLSEKKDCYVPCQSKLKKKSRKLIESADLICYPPGSFYTSLLANLLPNGVAKAIAENDCPKVYVPSLGNDPEQLGMGFEESVRGLLDHLHKDMPPSCPSNRLMNYVLVDTKNAEYGNDFSTGFLKKLGVEFIDTRLVSKQSAPYYDNELLVSALLSLA